MKRINITQATAVIGVAGLLGFAMTAIAGDQKEAVKPAVTNPDSLMKFAHTSVVNATLGRNLATGTILCWNFALSRAWAFKGGPDSVAPDERTVEPLVRDPVP